MKQGLVKSGIGLIILGEILYLILRYFIEEGTSDFSNFTQGVLLGLSVGIKLIGVILVLIYIVKDKKKEGKNEKN